MSIRFLSALFPRSLETRVLDEIKYITGRADSIFYLLVSRRCFIVSVYEFADIIIAECRIVGLAVRNETRRASLIILLKFT